MLLAHVIELRPTAEQEQYLAQAAGIRRFVFNKGLDWWKSQVEAGIKPTKQWLRIYRGRQVHVTAPRIQQDFAQPMKRLVDVYFPTADVIRWVVDNLVVLKWAF